MKCLKKEIFSSNNQNNKQSSVTVIPIVFASDKNYLKYTYITMLSCLRNTKSFIDFFIMVPNDLKSNLLKIFDKLKTFSNCSVNIIKIGDIFDDCAINIKHITKPTYYRLLIADILPSYYDKCIYLDADVIVNGDIKEYFDIDLKNNFIAGVKAAGYHIDDKDHAKRLNIPSISTYINAGVTLWNLKKIRESNKTKELIELSKKNFDSQDQDIINVAFFNNIKLLSLRYNFMTKYKSLFDTSLPEYTKLCEVYGKEDVESAKNNPLIIHYADRVKPWNNKKIPLAELWYKYSKGCIVTIFSKKLMYPLTKFIQHIREVAPFSIFGSIRQK